MSNHLRIRSVGQMNVTRRAHDRSTEDLGSIQSTAMWVKGRVGNLRERGKPPFPKGGGALSQALEAGYPLNRSRVRTG